MILIIAFFNIHQLQNLKTPATESGENESQLQEQIEELKVWQEKVSAKFRLFFFCFFVLVNINQYKFLFDLSTLCVMLDCGQICIYFSPE